MTGFRTWSFPDRPWKEPVPRRPRRRPVVVVVDGWVVPSNAARAVGRFRPSGPLGYRADVEGAPLRATRAEAVADWIAARPEAGS